jgi:hypothetical protein
MPNTRLLAIHIERRSVAVAVFSDNQLEHTEIRHLSSDQSIAEKTLIEFVKRKLAQSETDRVVLQALPIDATERARAMNSALVKSLRETAVSIWHIPESTLFQAFGLPALTNRHQLHQSIGEIWPSLKSIRNGRVVLGAAALGLHFQTEHALSLATESR